MKILFILVFTMKLVIAEPIVSQYKLSVYSVYVTQQITNDLKNNQVTRVELTYSGAMIFLANDIKQQLIKIATVPIDMTNLGLYNNQTLGYIIVTLYGIRKIPQLQGSFYDYTSPNMGFYQY